MRVRNLADALINTEPFHADINDAFYPVPEKNGYDVVLGALTQEVSRVLKRHERWKRRPGAHQVQRELGLDSVSPFHPGPDVLVLRQPHFDLVL